jgi:hypothetical protein
VQYADAYVRVQYRPISQGELAALGEKLNYSAIAIARDIFGRGYEVDFFIEEGSVRERIRVYGKLLLWLMGSVVAMDQFPEAVEDLVQKAHTYGEATIAKFEQVTGTHPDQVISRRTQSRDVNRLNRIARNLNLLEHRYGSSAERERLRDDIITDIAGLYLSDRDDPGVQALLDQLRKHNVPHLPQTPSEVIEWLDQRRRAYPKARPTAPAPRYITGPRAHLITDQTTETNLRSRRRARYHQRTQT